MDGYAFVLNAGSSSLKFCVYRRPAADAAGRSDFDGAGRHEARRALDAGHGHSLEPTRDVRARGALDVAPSAAGTSSFFFTPVELLRTSTQYTVGVGSLVDTSGAPLAEVPAVTVQTTAAPEVVRFRPKHATQNVARSAKLSVRFTQSMDPATTKAALVTRAIQDGIIDVDDL